MKSGNLAAIGGDGNALTGNIKVTRDDWLRAALDVLINDGVDAVKIMNIGERLEVSRSSFYWYFKSRQELLDGLLDQWQRTNTAALVAQASASAETITAAVCNVFRCVVNPDLFDTRLDFAIRDWARKSGAVSRVLDQSDERRLQALIDMFKRFDYPDREATARAKILYFMQIGYNDADLREPMAHRLKLLPEYLLGFTGQEAEVGEIEEFTDYALGLNQEASEPLEGRRP